VTAAARREAPSLWAPLLLALAACATARPPGGAAGAPAPAPDPCGPRAPGGEEPDAVLERAGCLYRRGDLAGAAAALDALAGRAGVAAEVRVRALTERGVVALEAGDRDAAETLLRAALELHARAGEDERLEALGAARAWYWLGEAQRARFLALPVDTALPEPELAERLEEKCLALLEAQERYRRAVLPGSPAFAAAALSRVGELHEALAAELAAAPAPAGLDAAEERAWRAELRRSLRPVLARALEAYDATIAVARARGVEGEFLEEAEEALQRLQREMAEEGP
jgi:hypothetical protein